MERAKVHVGKDLLVVSKGNMASHDREKNSLNVVLLYQSVSVQFCGFASAPVSCASPIARHCVYFITALKA